MKSIQEIAAECKPGDKIYSSVWAPGLFAKIVVITDEGVAIEGDHMREGYVAKFSKHKPEWKTWTVVR